MKKISILVLAILAVTLTACSSSNTAKPAENSLSLTSERIQELRSEYPLSQASSPNVEMRDIPFEEVLSYADSVIIAEVVEQNPDLEVELIAEPGTPEGNLADKEKANGEGPPSADFISYKVKVRELVAGEEVSGDVNLIYNSELQDVEPQLQPGMEILTAIKKGVGDEQQGSYSFTRYGTYYVVDENYVLSAFQGQDEEMKSFTEQTDGKTLQNLIDRVRSIKTD
ncbi:hypothetical protein QWJ34_09385 [Saccharibacillus sp. CPCC 101409]|uniref:hypothetical protein n=1 Tax=Saccharibacillus sp. CPCC 101409 TaxID=3058041 RepID=UPI0026741350|nr:hypothetical protein [Saccharibacillus sp. CPCC 101409]MDO3409972.1 hypothetical protein [Saccharibacillus sp. CPCC 101409]